MRKITVGLFGLGGLIAAILLARPRFVMRWVERNTPEDALFSVDTTEKVIALTIDDGPHAEITPQILDILAAYQIKATFFLIGKNVLENGDLVNQIAAGGHEIGNHLMQDQPSIGLKDEVFVDELLENGMLLASYGPVRWFRPGSGWYTRKMLAAAKSYGYRCAVGSIYPYDAHISNVPFIAGYVLANAYPGAVIILHDGTDERWYTVDVLKMILPDLLRRGYQFRTLSELAGD